MIPYAQEGMFIIAIILIVWMAWDIVRRDMKE